MAVSWTQRSEPLRLVVADAPAHGLHKKVGDAPHRFSVRSGDPLLVIVDPYQSLRPLVATLLSGGTVVSFLEDVHDARRVATRLYRYAPGHMHAINTALFDGQHWYGAPLHEHAERYA